MTKLRRLLFLFIPLALATSSGMAISLAHAGEVQSLDDLRAAVISYLESQAPKVKGTIHVEVGNLDERLQLPECLGGMKAFTPPGARAVGNVSVGVRCETPVAWSIYVPARVEVHDSVLIVNRALSRGAILNATDVEMAEQDVTSFSDGYFTEVAPVIGKGLRRPLAAGSVLLPGYLQEPRIVKRGDRVTLLVRTAGMEVRVEGEALEEGGRGDRIRARNLKTKREVQGTVIGPDTIEIRLQ